MPSFSASSQRGNEDLAAKARPEFLGVDRIGKAKRMMSGVVLKIELPHAASESRSRSPSV
jgi:hypothetical protein